MGGSSEMKAFREKPPVFRGVLQYFPLALAEVAKVSAHGAEKYTWNTEWKRGEEKYLWYSDALMRHLLAAGRDEESGIPHEAHAAWNALARLEILLHNTLDKKE